MPRSRNSRSASPQKSVPTESIADFEHRSTFKNVHDIFCEAIDADVIQLVLQECSWNEEEAIEKLLTIAESRDEQRKYKSKLHRLAEGLFGSLRSEDYGQNITITAASSLSPSEKVIRRPTKSHATSEKTGACTPKQNVSSSEQLLSKTSFYLSGGQGNGNTLVDEIEMDFHFPQLPKKALESNLSSASSSVSSQRSHNGVTKSSSSKTVLLSQAQSAFNQQYDDAEGTQRWEQYKQKLSEHYLVGLTKENSGASVKGQYLNITSRQSSSSFPDDPAILQAELESPRSESIVSQKDVERPRSETGRSFPVRLLSRSPDTIQEDNLPCLISGQSVPSQAEINEFTSSGKLDSDLDETVLKCIYEVHGDWLDEKLERSLLSQNADAKKPGTPTSQGQTTTSQSIKPMAQQSNEAMTLPTIGLSVNAIEFVPRPKPIVTTSVATSVVTTVVTPEVKDSSLQPASKMTKSTSIEIKSGVQNARITSPSVTAARSPLTVSPSLSPGLSPPATLINSPVTNLTGSPMFITPKWPQVFHSVNRPPPMAPPTVLASTTSRFINPNPTHLTPPGYRFPQPGPLPPGPLPFSSRMLYTVAPPPPLFRMAGMPHRYVPPPTVEDRAAIATGQPIMATSESARHISPPTGLPPVKLTFLEQKVERLRALQQSGLKVLVIVRGLPGSGKTTLSRVLQLNGIVLSTDDYYMKGNIYDYSPDKLTEAHQWNRERSKEAMKMRKSPIIIDNTNTQVWEFKPYISMALTYNYHIELFEPETPWKYNSKELARRTLHGVPRDQIERMCNRYEHNITVDMVIRKRKADPKINETFDASENAGEFSRLDEKPSACQEEPSAHAGIINETKSTKDLIRLQNFYKGEDLRKQKSAESDSDSISSSLHSGSLSNQSSRNASPKPLRPSLKTPVALHKMEKLKPPVTAKPIAINPAANKVKRKAIKQMESKLSSETVHVVDDMVNEHVGDKILSVDDVRKLEDELKALLMFYPINESEVVAAEELIGLKLHDIIHQSIEILEKEDDAEEDSDYESTENVHNKDTELETCDNAENAVNILEHAKELKKLSENKEVVVLEPQEIGNKQNEVGKKIEVDSLKTVTHNEIDALQNGLKTAGLDVSKTDRVFPSWTEIANIKKDVSVNIGIKESRRLCHASGDFATIDGIMESIKLDNAAVDIDDINTNEFELQYWGKLTASCENKVIAAESIQNPWDDIACDNWEGSTSTGYMTNLTESENGATPRRQKRNESVDEFSGLALTNEVTEINSIDDVADEENVDISVNTNVDSDIENNSEQLNGIKEEINQFCVIVEIEAKPHSLVCAEEVAGTANEIKDTFTETEIVDKHISCENVSRNDRENDIEATFCSSFGIDESQDIAHVSSHSNSSLQMLKESYIDIESAINSQTDTDNDKGLIVISDMDTNNTRAGKVKSEIYDDLNDIELESSVRVYVDHVNFYEGKLTESGTTTLKDENCINVQSSDNGDICEENSDDITGYYSSESWSSSEIGSEDITEAKSSESLLCTEVISVDITEVQSSESLLCTEVKSVDITEVKSSESLPSMKEASVNITEEKSSECLPISEVGSVDITEVKSSEIVILSEDSEMESNMKSETDSLMTLQTYTHKPSTPASAQRNKKPSKRKMAANLRGPFLNNEDKEKFRTNAWNSFPIRGIEKQVSSPTTTRKLRNGRDLANAMTVTEMEYFNLVTRLNNGGFVDGSIKYLTGNARTIFNGNHSGVELNKLNDTNFVNEILTIDKSTSTDDFVSMTDTESVEFLQTCFPAVPLAELECVLENCANNVEWAINLLLDWKYSLDLTEDEKQKFTEVMAEVKKHTSPEIVEPCSSANKTGPISLLDLCFSVVERGNIASREDLELQLIQTSKERLDRIEDDNITKIRLHRSTSLNETYLNVGNNTPSKRDSSVFMSLRSTDEIEHQSIYQGIENNEPQKCVAESKVITNADSNINETGETEGINIVKDYDKTSDVEHIFEMGIFGDDIDVDVAETVLLNHDAETENEDDGDLIQPALTMTIESDVIGKLKDMFGPFGNRNDVYDDLLVSLDHKTAWLIYQCVKQSVKSRRSQLQFEQQQLVKDEEFARQLQDEENAYVRTLPKGTRVEDAATGSRSKRSTPLVGLSVMGTIPQHIEPVAWNRGNKSLAEIMQEEQIIEDNQQKLVKLIVRDGGHTAASTRLKRQILYRRFPKLEKNILDEILQDYCFSLTETFDAISLWLGEDVMSATSATTLKQDDQQLLETTKQQSMQDMLDSYIYHPVVGKDYQDGVEPEYEDYRGEANLHYRLRNECFQKAREAYSRGLKQVASFYSQQGHQHTQKIKEANMRASKQILAERNNDIEKNLTLDLHGLHVNEAIEAIDNIIQRKEIEHRKNLTIITGRGSHSRGGVARLRPSIIAYLKTHKYSYNELQTGVFRVSLKHRT